MTVRGVDYGKVYEETIRPSMRKTVWCPGCGLGTLQRVFTEVLIRATAMKMGIDPGQVLPGSPALERVKNKVVVLGGIGCSSRMPGHLDLHTIHTTHGRPLAYATGLKMARDNLEVAVASGDGDSVAIGGNHFIHAARRNLDITLVLYNNFVYGMTSGQHSPTTPLGERATSMPYGNFEPPFNLAKLAIGGGASFVAQGAITNSPEHFDHQLAELLFRAFMHRGFSFVNVWERVIRRGGGEIPDPGSLEMMLFTIGLTLKRRSSRSMCGSSSLLLNRKSFIPWG